MAFRKRKFFRRRFNGKLSKKHYTWVTALNTMCECVQLNSCGHDVPGAFCCPSEAQLVLLDNAVIQSSFQDAIRVVKILGELRFSWDLLDNAADFFTLEPTCEEQATWFDTFNSLCGKAASGIAVREVHNGDLATLPKMNPVEDFDFSEGRWKAMRFHTSLPDNLYASSFQCDSSTTATGICSDVNGTSPGATTTICTPTALAPQITSYGSMATHVPGNMRSWVWRYNTKLNLRIRENQLPVMSVGWGHQDLWNNQLRPLGLTMMGQVKLLIEVG